MKTRPFIEMVDYVWHSVRGEAIKAQGGSVAARGDAA
jgi:hypothetical protein